MRDLGAQGVVPPVVAALPTSSGTGAILRLSTDGELYEDRGGAWRRVRSGDMLKSVYDTNNDGRIDPAALGTGPASSATFLNGAGAWAVPPGLQNLALSHSYGVTPAPSAAYPDSGGELTNGLRATTNSFTDAAYTGWNGFPAQVVVTIDLGQSVYLSRVVGYFYSSHANGIYTPTTINLDVSTDNTTFTNWFTGVAPDQSTDNAEILWTYTPASSATGRYVRFTLVGQGSKEWMFVSELEVYGRQVADNDPRLLGNSVPALVVTSNYTVSATDGVVFADASSGPLTITLPSASSAVSNGRGQLVRIKKIDATGNAVTVTASGGQVDGAANAVISTPYNAFEFIPIPGTSNWGGF